MAKRRRTKTKRLDRDQVSIQHEAEYIVQRAAQHDARVVSLGPLVFFSTDTGDAWVLDFEDHLALCLAIDGERLPARIVETHDTFSIEWTGTYSIDGDLMTFADRSGRMKAVLGYPTDEIVRAAQRPKKRDDR